VAAIWGQTRNLDDWTLDPADLSKRRLGGPSRLWCPDMGTDTMSDMPIMVGIWGQTRNLDDRTLDPVDLTKRRSGGPSRRGAQIWGQTRCPICRSGTFNVKRSTLNVQWGDRKGVWWAGYGDRHAIWTTGLLTRWT
jgi:hypothetical protein